MPSQTVLLGAAGEHHVMAELLRRDYIAALAPQGMSKADILVTDSRGERHCSIQVKTRRDRGSDGGWHMNEKHEKIRDKHLFYCFVDFGKTPHDRPEVYVLPSERVADALQRSHSSWLNIPGKQGQKRNDSPMRRLLPDYKGLFEPENNPYPKGWLDEYRDAWNLFGLDPVDENQEAG